MKRIQETKCRLYCSESEFISDETVLPSEQSTGARSDEFQAAVRAARLSMAPLSVAVAAAAHIHRGTPSEFNAMFKASVPEGGADPGTGVRDVSGVFLSPVHRAAARVRASDLPSGVTLSTKTVRDFPVIVRVDSAVYEISCTLFFSEGVLFVSFRPSTTFSNWKMGVNTRVRGGVQLSFLMAYSHVRRPLVRLVAALVKDNPDARVSVVGMSLGGALAVLFMDDLARQLPSVAKRSRVVAFGAPPIFTRRFRDEMPLLLKRQLLAGRHVSFVNSGDPIGEMKRTGNAGAKLVRLIHAVPPTILRPNCKHGPGLFHLTGMKCHGTYMDIEFSPRSLRLLIASAIKTFL